MLLIVGVFFIFFFFKQKTAYEMRISDWSSDVCSSDLWITSRVLAKITRRALTAIGQDDWSVALSRRRVFRNVSYAVPLLVIMSNIGLLPIDGKYATLLADRKSTRLNSSH